MVVGTPGGVAFWCSYVFAWREHHVDEAVAMLWRRVAYATRYGRIGLGEAMALGQDDLQAFISAVSSIVQEENPGPGSLHDR
jgi:hypothetical protein